MFFACAATMHGLHSSGPLQDQAYSSRTELLAIPACMLGVYVYQCMACTYVRCVCIPVYGMYVRCVCIPDCAYLVPGAHEPPEGSVQLRATTFDFERFRHLPYMDISSSGESPFVVTAHTCETSATYCVSTRTERVLLLRARDANSRIVNITRGPRIHDGARARR